ncbi:hypothetical protein ACQ4PT_070077 [Festuca glaucescens]
MVHVRSAPSAAPPATQPSRTFAELGICQELLDACEAMGWRAPTKIQSEAIPHALEGMYSLAPVQQNRRTAGHVDSSLCRGCRELAIQIAEQFEALGSAIGLVCAVLVGGVDRMKQVISLAKRPHIVVATPGRLLDHLTDTKGFSLKNLKYLVLDEADQLLDVQFEKTYDDIINVIPKERRTYLFSATMTAKVGYRQVLLL